MLVTFLIYLPGLSGDFIFDDFVNIVDNQDSHLQSLSAEDLATVWTSGVTTTINRPLSMLSFGLNYYFSGLDPFYYKLTSLVVHLLTGVGIYLLSRELLSLSAQPRSEPAYSHQILALIVTTCWLLHPLFVSSVLYVVQRMTLLSALTTVFTLIFYCRFRQREVGLPAGIGAFGIFVFLVLLGVMFKENAILTVLFCLLMEFYLLHFRAESAGQKAFLKLFVILLVIIPAVGGIAALIISPESITGNYDIRTFTLWERLMSESRIVWMYAHWLIMPDTRQLVFHHDNFAISRGIVQPLTTLLSILGLATVSVFCIVLRKRLPYLCFGIAFFLAGHLLESTIINLELVFEHRNYLPGFGLLFGAVHTLANANQAILRHKTAIAFLGLFLAFLAHGTYQETRKWSGTREHLLAIVRENPGSHRINYSLGFYYLNLATLVADNAPIYDASSIYFKRSIPLDAKAIRGHIGAIMADSQNEKPLDDDVVSDLLIRLRTYSLLGDAADEVSKLTECYYGNFCKFDTNILIRIYTAIAQNEVDAPFARQAILAQIATAIASIYNRPQDGLALLYLARGLSSELTIIDLQIVQLETELDNFVMAREAIAVARQKSGTDFLEQELRNLELRLQETEAN